MCCFLILTLGLFFLFLLSGKFCLCNGHCGWYVVVGFRFCYFSLSVVGFSVLGFFFVLVDCNIPGFKFQHYYSYNRQQQGDSTQIFPLFPTVSFFWKPWSLSQRKVIQTFGHSSQRNFVAPSFLGFHLSCYSGSGNPRRCPPLPPQLARQQICALFFSDHCCVGG